MPKGFSPKTVWVRVPIPHHLALKLDEYNKQVNKEDKIDIRKLTQKIISQVVDTMDRNTEYCHGCQTLLPIEKFNNQTDWYCKSCTEERKQRYLQIRKNSVRYRALERTDWKCAICGNDTRDLHHIIPRHLGGKNEYNNLIALCRKCHDDAHNHHYIDPSDLNQEMIKKFNEIIQASA